MSTSATRAEVINAPRHNVDPPLKMIFPYNVFRRSKSVRFRESTMTCHRPKKEQRILIRNYFRQLVSRPASWAPYLMYAHVFQPDQFRVEQNFRCPISFRAELQKTQDQDGTLSFSRFPAGGHLTASSSTHLDRLSIRQPKLFRSPHQILVLFQHVRRHIARLFLDRSHHLFFRRGMQVMT